MNKKKFQWNWWKLMLTKEKNVMAKKEVERNNMYIYQHY